MSTPGIVEADPAYKSVQAHGHQGTLKDIPSPYETTQSLVSDEVKNQHQLMQTRDYGR